MTNKTSKSGSKIDSNTFPPPNVLVETLESLVLKRHSTRSLKSDPVPKALLEECLSLAQYAASNSNIQNWRLTIASGPARDRIVTALHKASTEHPPSLPPLPGQFKHLRDQLIERIYGDNGWGALGAQNEAARQAIRMRNFRFFEAPVCAVISMDEELGMTDALSVGLFVENFTLALTARGLGSCLQISVTGYADVLREGFDMEEGQRILCGTAIGWPSDDKINDVVTERESIDRSVRFLE